jgi:hypothetical protein
VTGSANDDRIGVADNTASVNAGAGNLDMLDTSAVMNFNLDAAGTTYQNIEKIDLRGGVTNTLTLNAQDVLDLSSTTDSVLVRGDSGDTVQIGGGWTQGATVSDPGGWSESGSFVTYTQVIGGQTATLLVEAAVSVA